MDAGKMVGGDRDILRLQGLRVSFRTDDGLLRAVDGVDLSIRKGRTLGLVGESGCGKSVTAFSILRLITDRCSIEGRILFRGGEGPEAAWEDLASYDPYSREIRRVRGGRISMIFQEPMSSFSGLYTLGNQLMESVWLHRSKDPKTVREITLDMIRKVQIPEPEKRVDQYPFEFSGGMRQRMMIAMALSCHPSLLIADEPTTALDVTIQAQVLDLMRNLQGELGMSILFITHDMGVVAEMCDDVEVMYLGTNVESAPVEELFRNPLHPYTVGLLKAIPSVRGPIKDKLHVIAGSVPLPVNLPAACRFFPRCEKAMVGVCDKAEPTFRRMGPDHRVKCFLYTGDGKGE